MVILVHKNMQNDLYVPRGFYLLQLQLMLLRHCCMAAAVPLVPACTNKHQTLYSLMSALLQVALDCVQHRAVMAAAAAAGAAEAVPVAAAGACCWQNRQSRRELSL